MEGDFADLEALLNGSAEPAASEEAALDEDDPFASLDALFGSAADMPSEAVTNSGSGGTVTPADGTVAKPNPALVPMLAPTDSAGEGEGHDEPERPRSVRRRSPSPTADAEAAAAVQAAEEEAAAIDAAVQAAEEEAAAEAATAAAAVQAAEAAEEAAAEAVLGEAAAEAEVAEEGDEEPRLEPATAEMEEPEELDIFAKMAAKAKAREAKCRGESPPVLMDADAPVKPAALVLVHEEEHEEEEEEQQQQQQQQDEQDEQEELDEGRAAQEGWPAGDGADEDDDDDDEEGAEQEDTDALSPLIVVVPNAVAPLPSLLAGRQVPRPPNLNQWARSSQLCPITGSESVGLQRNLSSDAAVTGSVAGALPILSAGHVPIVL